MSVRHALLALLSEGPKYGLQLREEFEAVSYTHLTLPTICSV